MSDVKKLYIAGMGMITPVGANTTMTAAAVNAGMSAYAISGFYGQNKKPITMASVPSSIFSKIDAEIEKGTFFDARHDRVIKMAIVAIREACAQRETAKPARLTLAMSPEQCDIEGLVPLIRTLETNCKPWVSAALSHNIYSGRAAGIEAIDYAFRNSPAWADDFMLIGGSDSYRDYSRLSPLTKAQRLLTTSSSDGFAPGEAAGFLLLTRFPELAQSRNGHIIALHPPGIADEPGHLSSEEPYRGDGLDAAFKQALANQPLSSIHSIYSSMNGENHWAKEYGVAFIRSQEFFIDPVRIEHPADCYGDLGAATGAVLIALAAEHLFSHATAKAHLVYSSSDTEKRGAIVVEKTAYAKGDTQRDAHQFPNKV